MKLPLVLENELLYEGRGVLRWNWIRVYDAKNTWVTDISWRFTSRGIINSRLFSRF
ncbi:hypothetical protein Hanom_Chr04g00282451 [Helianthus anomalus]